MATITRGTLSGAELTSYNLLQMSVDARDNLCFVDITNLKPDGTGYSYTKPSYEVPKGFTQVDEARRLVTNDLDAIDLLHELTSPHRPHSVTYQGFLRVFRALEAGRDNNLYVDVSDLRADGTGIVHNVDVEQYFTGDLYLRNPYTCFCTALTYRYCSRTYEQYVNYHNVRFPLRAEKACSIGATSDEPKDKGIGEMTPE